MRFLQLVICEFYPSISLKLLTNALNFASKHTKSPISSDTKDIILHARKSFLFSYNSRGNVPWTKHNGTFDVTMGAPDGAEVCELVGLFLLSQIKSKFPELDFGLYRDDGLAVHRRIPGPRLDSIRKQLIELFKSHGLSITLELPNLTHSDFLDARLDLAREIHAPYRKPNDRPLYVHKESNHPANVLKEVPKSVNKKLSSLSSSAKEFDEAKEPYQRALDESGYDHKLVYEEPAAPKPKGKGRKRDIIWFNPPFNKAVTTNVGKQFLQLVSKHFPKGSPLGSLLNRNTVKISYSCTKNMKTIISSHNRKILAERPQTPTKKCNCQARNKSNCPLDGNCRQFNVVYHAVTEDDKKYIGSTTDFKKRYYGHKDSFRNPNNKSSTTLASHIWEAGLSPDPRLKWSIIANATPYAKGNRQCDLCLTEKLHISKIFNNSSYLNKRSELALRCRHRAKYLLVPPSRE